MQQLILVGLAGGQNVASVPGLPRHPRAFNCAGEGNIEAA